MNIKSIGTLADGQHNLGAIGRLWVLPMRYLTAIPEPEGINSMIPVDEVTYTGIAGWMAIKFTMGTCFLKMTTKNTDAGLQYTYELELRNPTNSPERRSLLELVENDMLLTVAEDANGDTVLLGAMDDDEKYGLVLNTEYGSGAELKDSNRESLFLKLEILRRCFFCSNVDDLTVLP